MPALLLQTTVVYQALVQAPSALLLLLPSSLARAAFCSVARSCQVVWLGFATALVRFLLGVRVVLHVDGGVNRFEEAMLAGGDALIVSNHRTRIDWMFLWGLAATMGRLGGLKIVLKAALRNVPFVGWACQCFGFVFMARSNRDEDLKNLSRVVALYGGRGTLAVLLFPEGTDLSEANLLRSQMYAQRMALPKYSTVLHPRTAGFAHVAGELTSMARKQAAASPVIVDVTMGYVDYVPEERPTEKSVFARGRVCREVHMRVSTVLGPVADGAQEAEDICNKLFAEKEARLARFYKPCFFGELPNIDALSEDCETRALEATRGGAWAMFVGLLGVACVQQAGMAVASRFGVLIAYFGFFASSVFLGFACVAWGGMDQVLFRHMEQHPVCTKCE